MNIPLISQSCVIVINQQNKIYISRKVIRVYTRPYILRSIKMSNTFHEIFPTAKNLGTLSKVSDLASARRKEVNYSSYLPRTFGG